MGKGRGVAFRVRGGVSAAGSGAEPEGSQAEIGNAITVSLGNTFDDPAEVEKPWGRSWKNRGGGAH